MLRRFHHAENRKVFFDKKPDTDLASGCGTLWLKASRLTDERKKIEPPAID
jgi:hypothetical protein